MSEQSFIVPAILTDNITDFKVRLSIAKHLLKHSLSKRLQIDIVTDDDGPPSVTPEQIYASCGNIHQDFSVDWHLMVSDIDKYYQQIIGANLIIIEYDTNISLPAWLHYKQMIPNLGLAFDLDINVDQISPFADHANHILVLANKAGRSGQRVLLEPTMAKVRILRRMYPDKEIGWDIGVSDSNIKNIFASGVNVANVSSYIFNSSDPEMSWDRLHRATLI